MRVLVITLVIVAIALLFSVPTIYALVKAHPARKRRIYLFAAIGNVFWLLFPLLIFARLSGFTRITRSILGPPFFTWIMFSLLYGAFAIVVALVRLAVARRTPYARFAGRASTAFLLVLFVTAVAGFVQCVFTLEVRHVPLTFADLPPGLHGYRIAQMSDLHVGVFTRRSRLEQFAREIVQARADAVVLTGDMIDDDPIFSEKLKEGLAHVPPQIPVFGVLGNHEMYGDPRDVIRRLEGSRIQLLVNSGVLVERNGSRLWIAGPSDRAALQTGRPAMPDLAPNLGRALAHRPPDAFPVVISHQPDIFAESKKRSLPLTIVGHTHGGQCGFRPLGWTLAGVFLPYHLGLYREGASWLYVNTGTGYWLVPIRVGLTPEITVFELRRGQAGR